VSRTGDEEKTAAPFVPKTTSLKVLSAASHDCRGCDLCKSATQVVFGEGPKSARVMFVGEQPGDQEDRKRRIHKKSRASEVKACRPWLEAELRAVKPAVVVCLGATAAQSMLGASFKLMQQRGQLISSPAAERIVATIHPSAVLRAPDSEGRKAAYDMLVADLKVVVKALRP